MAKESSQGSCSTGSEKPTECTGRYMPIRHPFIHRTQHSTLPIVKCYINIFWIKLCFILKMIKHKMYLSSLLCKCYTSASWEMFAGTSLWPSLMNFDLTSHLNALEFQKTNISSCNLNDNQQAIFSLLIYRKLVVTAGN